LRFVALVFFHPAPLTVIIIYHDIYVLSIDIAYNVISVSLYKMYIDIMGLLCYNGIVKRCSIVNCRPTDCRNEVKDNMSEEIKRPMTEARKRANAKYESKAYDKILLRVEAGQKDKIKAHAAAHQPESGEIGKPGYTPKGSVNGFISRAINEAMERDKEEM